MYGCTFRETGQVVYDKRGNNGLNLAVLHLANHMMTSPDLYGFLGYGDKDTFVSADDIGCDRV